VPRKKAPAAERAKQFGARGLPARCTSAASLSHLTRLPCTLPARCTSAASLSHLTRLPCTRVEGVERPRRRGAGQARMELHGVSALSECRAVLWNGRGRWGQPRWLHAPPIHNVSLYYHRFFLPEVRECTRAKPSLKTVLHLLDLLLPPVCVSTPFSLDSRHHRAKETCPRTSAGGGARWPRCASKYM
jgi:hypothetical protein